MISPARRPSLRLIRGALDDTPGWTCFCGECAAPPSEEPVSPLAAVCGAYGMGLLLETRLDAFPSRDDAFLVVDSQLTVQTISRQAATLLGVHEDDVVDEPVAQFLGPADAEAGVPEDLLHLIHRASTDSDQRHSVMVRPRNSFGVRLVARIAPCGPPRAALVLLRNRAPQLDLQIR
jgi:PAS domain-containing protein